MTNETEGRLSWSNKTGSFSSENVNPITGEVSTRAITDFGVLLHDCRTNTFEDAGLTRQIVRMKPKTDPFNDLLKDYNEEFFLSISSQQGPDSITYDCANTGTLFHVSINIDNYTLEAEYEQDSHYNIDLERPSALSIKQSPQPKPEEVKNAEVQQIIPIEESVKELVEFFKTYGMSTFTDKPLFEEDKEHEKALRLSDFLSERLIEGFGGESTLANHMIIESLEKSAAYLNDYELSGTQKEVFLLGLGVRIREYISNYRNLNDIGTVDKVLEEAVMRSLKKLQEKIENIETTEVIFKYNWGPYYIVSVVDKDNKVITQSPKGLGGEIQL